MVSRVLWGGTEEIRVSWQHWGETLCRSISIVKLHRAWYQLDLETQGNLPSTPYGCMHTAGREQSLVQPQKAALCTYP